MQGLPAALKDAERVSQELRISIDDLHVQSRRKSPSSKTEADVDQDRLSTRIRKRLRDTGVEEFFAGEYNGPQFFDRADHDPLLVQTALLPELAGLPLVPHPEEFLHDYLVSAPTGSGKTLSYVVPLIEVSMSRPDICASSQYLLPSWFRFCLDVSLHGCVP